MQEQERVIFSSHLRKSPIILKLTWEEKVKICEEWKQSGLGKKVFCKQKGIAPATFHGWCQKLWDIKAVFGNKLCAVKVVDKDAAVVKAEPIVLEVFFSNTVMARIKATEIQFSFLLREILDATQIIR